MKKIYFIDPQSYNNLALYDYSLLRNMKSGNIHFFGNSLFPYPYEDMGNFFPIFNYSNKRNQLLKGLSYLCSIAYLLVKIKTNRPNIIHIQWIRFWPIDYFFLKLLKKTIKGKIIYTAHNTLPHNSGNKLKNKYKKYYEKVDAIITHTNSSKSTLQHDFGIPEDKIKVIPHGLFSYPINEKVVTKKSDSFVKSYDLKDKIVFSMVGTQNYYKGTDIVAKVWSDFSDLYNNPQIKLLVCGREQNIHLSNLEGIKNAHVINRFITDEELVAIIKLSDVLLLPYREISQSGVLLLALNYKVPVLTSSAGGLSEVFDIANIGWNIGSACEENLYKTVKDIIKKPQQIKKIQEDSTAWKKIEDFYSWEKISRETFDFYRYMAKQ